MRQIPGSTLQLSPAKSYLFPLSVSTKRPIRKSLKHPVLWSAFPHGNKGKGKLNWKPRSVPISIHQRVETSEGFCCYRFFPFGHIESAWAEDGSIFTLELVWGISEEGCVLPFTVPSAHSSRSNSRDGHDKSALWSMGDFTDNSISPKCLISLHPAPVS